MKNKRNVIFIFLCLIVAALLWAGVGKYSSGSAVQDLKAEMESIYGTEYTGKETENGTEDMVFHVEPETWFFTNRGLRKAWNLDYRYTCKVIFTTYVDGSVKTIRTITYEAVDPMGESKTTQRAHMDLESKIEQIENN